jgi:hypothetical protein
MGALPMSKRRAQLATVVTMVTVMAASAVLTGCGGKASGSPSSKGSTTTGTQKKASKAPGY